MSAREVGDYDGSGAIQKCWPSIETQRKATSQFVPAAVGHNSSYLVLPSSDSAAQLRMNSPVVPL